MSDLVEKVNLAAIRASNPPNTGLEPTICWCAGCQGRVTRAAIKAVAEWLDVIQKYEYDKAGDLLRNQLEASDHE